MMRERTIREPARDIPVVCEADIVVLGGSCTGVFAAVRAARQGMRVALVEKQNCFGGVATAGLVNVWHSLHDTAGERGLIGGLTAEVIDRLDRRRAVLRSPNPAGAFRLNTEELKIELDELVRTHSIHPFLHAFYAAPVMGEGQLEAVLVETKSGRQAIRGRQFVDATGDADLARDVGVPLWAPDDLQPPSTCAKICGFDALSAADWQKAVRDHGHAFGLPADWGWGGAIPGVPGVQFRADTHVFKMDTTDGQGLTRAEMEGRRQVRALMDLLRTHVPGGDALALLDLGAVIGVRETARCSCDYRLKGDDVLYGRRFEDAIANGSYRVDIHHADGPGITFRYLDGTEAVIPERGMPPERGRWRDPLPEDPTFYQIPFRCLIQEHVPNLVVAGRALDADKTAFSAARVMVNTNQTGEAAGVACALAVKHDVPVHDVAAGDLREALAEGGSVVV